MILILHGAICQRAKHNQKFCNALNDEDQLRLIDVLFPPAISTPN